VEIKGIRRISGIHGEDAKGKRQTMESYWLPGVNRLDTYGHWVFLELRDLFAMETEFREWIAQAFQGEGLRE
jgi:type III restriction enzyme